MNKPTFLEFLRRRPKHRCLLRFIKVEFAIYLRIKAKFKTDTTRILHIHCWWCSNQNGSGGEAEDWGWENCFEINDFEWKHFKEVEFKVYI